MRHGSALSFLQLLNPAINETADFLYHTQPVRSTKHFELRVLLFLQIHR